MQGLDLGHKLEQDFEYNNCVKDADIYIRMGQLVLTFYKLVDFLRKIYSILSVQLVITLITGGILFSFKEPLTLFLLLK